MRRGVKVAFVLAVLFGSSTGAAVELPFAAATTLEGDYTYAWSVETGDIDGDGVLDVAAVAYGGTSLYWWRGAGDGTFTRLVVATSVGWGTDVEIADVDGDGDADLLVCAAGSADLIGWYENDGTPVDGGWTGYIISYPFNDASSAALGDLDGDGDLDAVGVALTAGDVAVALNNGAGVPSYETVDASFPLARWVSVGDISGDGIPDVIAASAAAAGEVAWWLRDGANTWTKRSIAAVSYAVSVELADMDRDGDLDALVSAGSDTTIRWYENNGVGGGWTSHPVGTAVDTVWAVLAEDLDRDGDLDIVFGEGEGDTVSWWENTDGDGTTWTLRTVDAAFENPLDIAVGDADGDGDLELFAVSWDTGDLVMWENLSIHRSALYPAGASAGAVDWVDDFQIVDVDGDGDLDLFAGDTETDQLVWSENDLGDGSSWTVHVIESEATVEALCAGDFNRDGLLDVARCTTTDISWWESDGIGGWTEHVVPATENSCRALKAADFDGDGDLDLIKGSNTTSFDWYENTDGVGGAWTESTAGSGWTYDADCVSVADMDGDGDVDVAAATGDRVTWLKNQLDDYGSLGGAQIVLEDIGAATRSIAVGDVDGDGDPDLASLKSADDVVVWFENTAGDGSAWGAEQTIVSSIDWPRAVALADLDLDGDLDCLVTAESGDSDCVLAWYENTAGDGSSWSEHVISTEMTRASIVAAADLDRDGDLDVVVDSVQGQARWWSNRGGQFAVSATATAAATLDEENLDDVLKIVVSHRGISDDSDLEPATLTLGLADADGVPLSQEESDALFDGIYVFEDDDDSGDFDPAFDSEVASQLPPVVTGGDAVLALPDGDSHLQVTPLLDRVLFVAVVLNSGAATTTPNQFQVVLRVGETTAEDWDHDTPLLVEYPVDVSSGFVTATVQTDIFSDDFESGDTTEWSSTVGG